MDRCPENCHPREKINQEIDQISGKGGNGAEDNELSWGGGSGHKHFERSRLLRFLNRAQEGLRAHYEESVDAGADQKEREVFDAIGPKAGTDGAGEKIKSRQFGEHSDQGHHETAAVADGRDHFAATDTTEIDTLSRHNA